MGNEVIPTPTIPEGLREAAGRGTLIPFVGAVASRLAGQLNWNEFADTALSFFVDKGKFTHSQLAQIRHLNAHVKLTIAVGLQNEHKAPIGHKRLIHPDGNSNNKRYEPLWQSVSYAKDFCNNKL